MFYLVLSTLELGSPIGGFLTTLLLWLGVLSIFIVTGLECGLIVYFNGRSYEPPVDEVDIFLIGKD